MKILISSNWQSHRKLSWLALSFDTFKYPSAWTIWAWHFETYFSAHHRLLPLSRRRKKTSIKRMQQLRRSGVSRVHGEKVAASWTEKLGTHSHTHTLTHSHTGRLLYPRYSPAAARVMTTKVLSSRPRIKCGETNNTALLTNIIMIPVLQCAGSLMNPLILITSGWMYNYKIILITAVPNSR